jgi:hypothetical protein
MKTGLEKQEAARQRAPRILLASRLRTKAERNRDMDMHKGEVLVFVNESHDRIDGIKPILEDWGYAVRLAPDFEQACDMLPGRQWDLVITDLSLVCEEGPSFLGRVLPVLPFSSVMILTEAFGSDPATENSHAPGFFLIQPGGAKRDIYFPLSEDGEDFEEQEAEGAKLKISLH